MRIQIEGQVTREKIMSALNEVLEQLETYGIAHFEEVKLSLNLIDFDGEGVTLLKNGEPFDLITKQFPTNNRPKFVLLKTLNE